MTELAFAAPTPARLDRRIALGTGISLALHAALLAALVLVSPLRQLIVPPPQPLSVEIVTLSDFAALQQPAPAPPVLVTPLQSREAAPPAEGDRLTPSVPLTPNLPENQIHRASQFYAAAILKEPGMERIRRAFGTLADGEKMVQLCNIEGLEQVRRVARQYAPDTLVPYAMSDPMGAGLTLTAAGGAFRSRRKWYGISFRCSIASDYSGVTAFEFKLGEAIPEDQWEAHNLNAEDEDE